MEAACRLSLRDRSGFNHADCKCRLEHISCHVTVHCRRRVICCSVFRVSYKLAFPVVAWSGLCWQSVFRTPRSLKILKPASFSCLNLKDTRYAAELTSCYSLLVPVNLCQCGQEETHASTHLQFNTESYLDKGTVLMSHAVRITWHRLNLSRFSWKEPWHVMEAPPC